MPFQALPIALRSNPGDAVAKLAWIYIVQNCSIDDAPNGMGWLQVDIRHIADFCQCSPDEARKALRLLRCQNLLGLISWKGWGDNGEGEEEALLDVNLPISQLHDSERRRIKASPDQIDALATAQKNQCVTCGDRDYTAGTSDWHVDHIIPRSKGGADVAENCQVICSTCNGRKGAKIHFVDFLGGRR